MDPLTQGALGATAASAAGGGHGRMAAAVIAGGLSGMAPDLDVLIRSDQDPLLFLEYHRQFTHALAFIPVGALLCALVLHPVLRQWQGFRLSYLYCVLGYATHGLLDACTSYGTQLFWPFSDWRVAWNWIAVIDPLFTLPLVALLLAAVLRRQPWPARLALGWAVAYLALGSLQGFRAHQAVEALASYRGDSPRQVLVKPSFGNLLVWKTVYASDGYYHVDAVRLGGDVLVYPGRRARLLDIGRDFPRLLPGSQQADDVGRFRRFSSGYLALEPGSPDRIIDVRYSMVPNEVDPLWGIEIAPQAPPERHVRFFTERQATPGHRRALAAMLRGSYQPQLSLPAPGVAAGPER